MTHAPPALDPAHIARLQRLTRNYARLTGEQAGLSSVLGGSFLILEAGGEILGHRGRFTWLGAFDPVPLGAAAAVATLPFLWWAARAFLARWSTARFGWVEPAAETSRRRAIQGGRWLGPALASAGVALVWTHPVTVPALRSALLVLLGAALAAAFPRLRGRAERLTAILLVLGAVLPLSGVQMAMGYTLLAWPIIGAFVLAKGLRDHAAFRRVRRELEGLREGA